MLSPSDDCFLLQIQILLLAPDIDRYDGLSDCIGELLTLAKGEEGVDGRAPTPVAFVLNRRRLAKATLRKVAISCVGVMNAQGSDVREE